LPIYAFLGNKKERKQKHNACLKRRKGGKDSGTRPNKLAESKKLPRGTHIQSEVSSTGSKKHTNAILKKRPLENRQAGGKGKKKRRRVIRSLLLLKRSA